MQGKVEISGVNTAKLKTLKNDEMVRLMKLAKAGDEQARQALIEGNLRLVCRAGRKSGRPVSGGLHWPFEGHCQL